MNNLFIEGPIQTGKSTLIRKILKEVFGPALEGVAGFTSQRITDNDGRLLAFRLAHACAELTVSVDAASLSPGADAKLENIFKWFTPDGTCIDMSVFETAGVECLTDAFTKAKAGQAKVVLLDEIGGHEMRCAVFRARLYKLLDSDIPCVGVIKSPDNTKRMDSTLLQLNEELHAHVSVTTGLDEFESQLRRYLYSTI